MAPVLIEDNIKAELPIVSQAMVVGDRRKFLSVLLTLRVSGEKKSLSKESRLLIQLEQRNFSFDSVLILVY